LKAEISDYVKDLIQRTRQGSHVIDGKISQDRVVGYFETILVGLTELERLATIGSYIEKLYTANGNTEYLEKLKAWAEKEAK
jgi:hypothetical protein